MRHGIAAVFWRVLPPSVTVNETFKPSAVAPPPLNAMVISSSSNMDATGACRTPPAVSSSTSAKVSRPSASASSAAATTMPRVVPAASPAAKATLPVRAVVKSSAPAAAAPRASMAQFSVSPPAAMSAPDSKATVQVAVSPSATLYGPATANTRSLAPLAAMDAVAVIAADTSPAAPTARSSSNTKVSSPSMTKSSKTATSAVMRRSPGAKVSVPAGNCAAAARSPKSAGAAVFITPVCVVTDQAIVRPASRAPPDNSTAKTALAPSPTGCDGAMSVATTGSLSVMTTAAPAVDARRSVTPPTETVTSSRKTSKASSASLRLSS